MHHKELIPVSKLLYRSYGDGFFGESEFDHVLFGFLQGVKPSLSKQVDPSEIMAVEWIQFGAIRNWITEKKSKNEPISPWFGKMVDTGLENWWGELRADGVEKFKKSIQSKTSN